VLEDLSDDHDDEWNTPSVKRGIEKLFTQDGCVFRWSNGTGVKHFLVIKEDKKTNIIGISIKNLETHT
jgi:hypothetical protein